MYEFNNIPYLVIIIGILTIVIFSTFLYKRLGNIKEQLKSCRSS